jgi:hypothetical protein
VKIFTLLSKILTTYRKLDGLNIDVDDIGRTPDGGKAYSKKILDLLLGKPDTSAKDTEINSLRREIETLKMANSELSKMSQNAFDSLQEEQKQVTELTSSLKAAQSLQLLSEQRVQQLEEHIKLLDTPKKKKKKNKFKRQ